ncbi:MAG TPA: hypothetical protein DE060_18205 [Lentisphaeria bacterium]|nr:hypothetical protein [Lentisphaeria bacterium]HCG51124.1 hypothetical protein [Lentisphaeria bacterium]
MFFDAVILRSCADALVLRRTKFPQGGLCCCVLRPFPELRFHSLNGFDTVEIPSAAACFYALHRRISFTYGT